MLSPLPCLLLKEQVVEKASLQTFAPINTTDPAPIPLYRGTL